MEENVKISIEGEGLSLTRMTNLQKAGQIISFLGYGRDGSGSSSDMQTTGAVVPVLATGRLAPRDLIQSSNAKTYPQKIVALAVYLQEQMGQSSFNPQELKTLFKKMGDEPKNFTRDLNAAVSLQYILCNDSATETYELTDKGSEAFRNSFTGSVAKKANGSKKSAAMKGVRDEVRALEVNGAMDGYPDYHNAPTKGDKILWLFEYAYKKGVSALSPAEIDFLSGRLRERIAVSGFTALNDRNLKKSFVTKTAEGFQIQKRGSDYLASLKPKE